MGLFSKKQLCSICKKNETTKILSDGCICTDCISQCGYFISAWDLKSMSVYSIQQAITANSENKERSTVYNKTKSIEKYIEVDEVNHFWKVPVYQPFVIFRYSDIVSFELIENGESITKGGLGSAIIGGALFGSVGAIAHDATCRRRTSGR